MPVTAWLKPIGERPVGNDGRVWNIMGRLFADDVSYATCQLSTVEEYSEWYHCYDFQNIDTALPDGQIIDGIEVRMGDYNVNDDANTPEWDILRIFLHESLALPPEPVPLSFLILSPEDKAGDLSVPTQFNQVDNAGGPNDTWGLKPLYSEAVKNNANFGCLFGVKHDGTASTNFRMDYLRLKLYYSSAPARKEQHIPGISQRSYRKRGRYR